MNVHKRGKMKDARADIKLVSRSHDKYSPSSAARKSIVEVPLADSNDVVGNVLSSIKKNIREFKSIDYVYVVDMHKNLVGVVSIRNLMEYKNATTVRSVMQKKLVVVSPETDQEKVADLAVKYGLKAVPIVENRKLIGVVPIEQILPILNRALREDILHLAGIHKGHLKYENTMQIPLFLSVLHRIPYLLVGLFGITMAAIFVSVFESTLQKYLILAFFMPAIVYMSDALGTQHQTLFVRDLAILGKELKITTYFFRQMIIGSLLAILISLIIFSVISIFWKQPLMAFVISIAMFAALVVTSFTALMVTLVISKFKLDPALGSGPIATIISDVTSIFIYFAIAVLLLGGL